jgi:hypothetical protein
MNCSSFVPRNNYRPGVLPTSSRCPSDIVPVSFRERGYSFLVFCEKSDFNSEGPRQNCGEPPHLTVKIPPFVPMEEESYTVVLSPATCLSSSGTFVTSDTFGSSEPVLWGRVPVLWGPCTRAPALVSPVFWGIGGRGESFLPLSAVHRPPPTFFTTPAKDWTEIICLL